MGGFSEVFLAGALCTALFGGTAEERTDIVLVDDRGYIRADCITPTHYIEVGLDGTASSRDSVVQAVSGAILRGLDPMVVVIDRDGAEDTHQWELEVTAARADVAFVVVPEALALRLVMSHHFRRVRERTLGQSPVAWVSE